MSIKRKLAAFIILVIVLPMLILFFVSRQVFNEQIANSEKRYLENAIKVAQNAMSSRKEEMKKATAMLAELPQFRQAVFAGDKEEIRKYVNYLYGQYSYLDFIVVVDRWQKPLLIHEDMAAFSPWDINGLVDKVKTGGRSIVAEEVIMLEQFYRPESPSFQKYKIMLVDGDGNPTDNYLYKGQVGLVVTPIYRDSEDEPAGFLIAGDITNNDNYFPSFYSSNVPYSFLALSVDGIRVTSNIKSPKRVDHIGSRMPLSTESVSNDNYYFGRVEIDGEIHVFVDKNIADNSGETKSVLGVGIPEDQFSAILDANNKAIVIVTFSCLVVMLLVSRYLSNLIINPIIAATEFAEKLGRGERNAIIPDIYLQEGRSETAILLRTFQKMANDLNEYEEQQQHYLNQLQVMVDELEMKVKVRTQDLQQVIDALRKADTVKSQFLANMSHELRTPLSAIIFCSEILKDRLIGELNPKQEKYIVNIFNSGTHLLQLINDILDISKIEAGKMKLNLSDFYISQIMAQSFEVVKTLAYRKNIDVSVVIDPPDFQVNADAQKLIQIVYNLLSNAIKFTGDSGQVAVTVRLCGDFVKLHVKDNGIGIKEEQQEIVFKEFEQADSSYGRQYEGTGLGLPLTRKLVEMHGGTIHLISQFGVGTEVIVNTPVNTSSYLNNSKIGKGSYGTCDDR